MHIVQFQHTRVPVEKYGGAQRIVVWLSQALVELGHNVTLLAGRGSSVPGVNVVEVDAEEVRRPAFDVYQYVNGQVDVMHYHGLVDHPPNVPYVATLHGNLGPGGAAPPYVICVSENHARRHGTKSYVYNGVRIDSTSSAPRNPTSISSSRGCIRPKAGASRSRRRSRSIFGSWSPADGGRRSHAG